MMRHYTLNTLAVAALAMVSGTAQAGVVAGTCGHAANHVRLVCDEGACVRVSRQDLCEAARLEPSTAGRHPTTGRFRTVAKPMSRTGEDDLTKLIASVY